MSGKAVAALLLGLAGCRGADAPARYEEALRAAEAGRAAEAVAACRAVRDEAARGDCLVAVADAAGSVAQAERACAALEPGTWLDECRFVLAERALAMGRIDEARERCRQAGGFAEDCLQHLWRVDCRTGWRPGDAAPAIIERCYGLYDRYLGRPADPAVWRQASEAWLDQAPEFDLGTCDALPPDARWWCREGAWSVLAMRLRGARGEVAEDDACARIREVVRATRAGEAARIESWTIRLRPGDLDRLASLAPPACRDASLTGAGAPRTPPRPPASR